MGYADAFYASWNLSYSEDLGIVSQAILASSLAYFTPSMGQTGYFALSVATGLSVYNFTSHEVLANLTAGMLMAQVDATPEFLRSVLELGPSPSPAEAGARPRGRGPA